MKKKEVLAWMLASAAVVAVSQPAAAAPPPDPAVVITSVSVGPYTPTTPGSGGCALTVQATLSGIVTGGLQAVAQYNSAGWTLQSYYEDRVARGQTAMTITSGVVFPPVDLQALTSVRVNLWRGSQRNIAATAFYPVSWDAADCQPPS